MLDTFVKLFLLVSAHLIADFPLQGDYLGTTKKGSMVSMLAHCWIWTGIVGTTLFLLTGSLTWWAICTLLLTHFLSDTVKCYWNRWNLVLDQLFHVLVCFVVSACLTGS